VDDDDFIDSDEVESSGSSDSEPASAAVASKEAERQRLRSEIEAFLASGGQISQIPPNVVADPPKKPESNYGGQPI